MTNDWTPWEAVSPDDPRGQPSAVYRGLVCYVSTDPCLAVVTADGSAVPPDQWPRVARLIAACPEATEALIGAEAALTYLIDTVGTSLTAILDAAELADLRGHRDAARAALSKALGHTGGA